MLGWTAIADFVTDYGWLWGIIIVALVIIICLVRIILDEDRSAAWRSRIYGAAYRVSGRSAAEKKYIENDISSRINLARRSMPFGQEYLPKALKIEWVEGTEGQTANIKEGEIVVRLDPAESQEKNVVLLADALVRQTSLIGIRHILREPLELSMDLNLIKNLLTEIGDRRMLDWFFREEYTPYVDKSAEIREWNGKIVEIDERGLFTRLLLVELDDYSKNVVGKPYSPEMFEEIAGLVNFLHRIATRGYREKVPLDYTSRNINIGVLIVGEMGKVLYSGIEPYIDAFAYRTRKQVTSIYVIQYDKDLVDAATAQEYVAYVATTDMLRQKIEQKFQTRKDFEQLKYTYTDPWGNKRKARISRYIPEYGLTYSPPIASSV